MEKAEVGMGTAATQDNGMILMHKSTWLRWQNSNVACALGSRLPGQRGPSLNSYRRLNSDSSGPVCHNGFHFLLLGYKIEMAFPENSDIRSDSHLFFQRSIFHQKGTLLRNQTHTLCISFMWHWLQPILVQGLDSLSYAEVGFCLAL